MSAWQGLYHDRQRRPTVPSCRNNRLAAPMLAVPSRFQYARSVHRDKTQNLAVRGIRRELRQRIIEVTTESLRIPIQRILPCPTTTIPRSPRDWISERSSPSLRCHFYPTRFSGG